MDKKNKVSYYTSLGFAYGTFLGSVLYLILDNYIAFLPSIALSGLFGYIYGKIKLKK